MQRQQAAKLDNMFESMTAGEKKTLNVVVKADVRGSLEAIQSALLDLGNEEVQVNIVTGGVGGITETDINLAVTSSAVVFGFNVRADNAARTLVEAEGVDLRYYNVIYDLIDDVKRRLPACWHLSCARRLSVLQKSATCSVRPSSARSLAAW